ncbi:MAG: DUF1697 domain-containing protein [Polyangiaceae bacterium]
MKKKAAKKTSAARPVPAPRGQARRYVAFLRGVSPMNCKMAELKRAFEAAGFADVKTVLASGNVVFSAQKATTSVLEKKVEAAISKGLGRSFSVLVRSVEALQALLASDPYESFSLPPLSKRVVTFLHEPPSNAPTLPIEMDGATILALSGSEVFSAYVPGPRGPVFMVLLEKTFGKDITTRTWGTVEKVTR